MKLEIVVAVPRGDQVSNICHVVDFDEQDVEDRVNAYMRRYENSCGTEEEVKDLIITDMMSDWFTKNYKVGWRFPQ